MEPRDGQSIVEHFERVMNEAIKIVKEVESEEQKHRALDLAAEFVPFVNERGKDEQSGTLVLSVMATLCALTEAIEQLRNE